MRKRDRTGNVKKVKKTKKLKKKHEKRKEIKYELEVVKRLKKEVKN